MRELDLTGVGAIYMRVSDDEQTVDRQRESTDRWLKRHGVTVQKRHTYMDEGWKRHQATVRPAFNKMLAAVEAGEINWIVVDRPDRFGAKDKFEAFAYLHRLREAGVRLFTVDDKELTSGETGDSITTHLDYDQSERELRDKSARALESSVTKTLEGRWVGGYVPFGMDVVCLSGGHEKWRVQIVADEQRIKILPDGTQTDHNGKNMFPAREKGQILTLRPTRDEHDLNAVRQVFEKYDAESISQTALARFLRTTGTRPVYAEVWQQWHVRSILTNPIYIGKLSWNKTTEGQYTALVGGERVQKGGGVKVGKHDRSDWVLSEELFKPIVDPELFERVQIKYDARHKRSKSPRSSSLWLSGLVYCAGCGRAMRGLVRPKSGPTYICSTYADACRDDLSKCQCQINAVLHSVIEGYVGRFLEETGASLEQFCGASQNMPPRDLQQATQEMMQAHGEMTSRLGLADPSGVDAEELMTRFATAYAAELPELKRKLASLNEEHDLVVSNLLRLPVTAKLAVEKAQREVTRLEAEIAEVTRRTEDSASKFFASLQQVTRIMQVWDSARKSLATETSSRRKAEAVRQVVARIECTFQPTGRFRPSSVLTHVKIIPVENPSGGSACPLLTEILGTRVFRHFEDFRGRRYTLTGKCPDRHRRS